MPPFTELHLIHNPVDVVYSVLGRNSPPRTGTVIHISLPDAEVEQLEERLDTTSDAKLRHRVQIVLMAHRGRRHPDIAADTGTTPRSVQRWLNAYLDRGLDGLTPRKAKGATPRLFSALRVLTRSINS